MNLTRSRRLPKLRDFERGVDGYAARHDLWPAAGRLLVGVSGGPDSSALLLALAALAGRRGLEITAAYFDHRLRGAEAALSERRAVEELASGLGVGLRTGGGDVGGLARAQKLSLEEAARRARYEFLAATARELGVDTVAVGHTSDDQAETVLMHLVRGAGPPGLAGIRPRSGFPVPGYSGLTLVRPLLGTSRRETLAYCAERGVQPIIDASNDSPVFLRNRVRADLLPLLRTYNPAIVDALNRLAESARVEVDALDALAWPAIRSHAPVRGRACVEIDRAVLREMAPGLRLHAVRLAVLGLLGDTQGFGAEHWSALVELATATAGGRSLNLPRQVRAAVRHGVVELRRVDGGAAPLPSPELTVLDVPGQARFGAYVLHAGEGPLEGAQACVRLDAKSVGPRVRVRSWRAGDRMEPAGMSGTKKLQDIFVDARVPRELRPTVPVLENDRGILWVAGLRYAGWAAPRPGEPVVTLSFREAVPA